jgi:hypothetical protein
VPSLVIEVHFHQDVAREEFALSLHLRAATDLDDFLSRHDDLGNLLGQALLAGLLADRRGDLVLKARIGVNDVPAMSHGQEIPSNVRTTKPMILSATRKKIAAITTKMKTMLVVIMVSRRVGQVTFATSDRTSRTNSTGFFVMLTL